MTEAVVLAALLGIRKHGIRFRGFLEPFLGCVITGIAIRVILHRQFAERALDFAIVRSARNAEHLVVVTFAHDVATFTIAGRSSFSPIR